MTEQITMLTGIKPTGIPHLGNYLGAIRPALQRAEGSNAYMFIADYHALNQISNPAELRRSSRSVAAAYLASGLDPARVTLYRQSDVPETFELASLLSNITPKGMLNRSHAYKSIVDAAREAGSEDVDAGVSMGLFNYPLLMAADILIMNAQQVPVGYDQRSHVEIATDLVQRFNHRYGSTFHFHEPQAVAADAASTVPGIDGRKMSKSYNNVIPIFGTEKELRKSVMKIVTDSIPMEEPKNLIASTLGRILAQVATPEVITQLDVRMAAGGVGYGEAKGVLFEVLNELAAPMRERYESLMLPGSALDETLRIGAGKARARASQVLHSVRVAVGID